ncbi:MAG: class E sortase [Jatrophihabitans sp.]
MGKGDQVRFVLRGVGQTLITLGLVVLLFVVYEVWITNLFSRDANNTIKNKIERQWAGGRDTLPLPGSGNSTIKLGTGIANIYIPRLGRDYHWTIVEGVSQDDLAKGPGHYPGTALPGQKGNFAVAGHRVGKGEPFLNIDQLKSGDTVIVETKASWFVYKVLGAPEGRNPETVSSVVTWTGGSAKLPGREIVEPSDGRVLHPVPDHADVAATGASEKLMTMTTCHPKFTAAKRMIVYAKLATEVAPVMNGTNRVEKMPAAIEALYQGVQA